MTGTISVVLNVKYMLGWKLVGTFGLVIAIVFGILVPIMLCLFGWLEKVIREDRSTESSNGRLKELVRPPEKISGNV